MSIVTSPVEKPGGSADSDWLEQVALQVGADYGSLAGGQTVDMAGVSLGPYVEDQGLWLDFDADDGLDAAAGAEVELISSTAAGVVGEVSIAGAWLSPVTVGGGEFSRLTVPGSGFTDVVGEPQLPVVRRLLSVPEGAEIAAQIVGRPELLSMAEVGLDRPLVPLQAPVEKVAGAREAARLSLDESVYQSDHFTPQSGVRVLESGYLSGRRLVMLEISPIAYNPVAGAVSVYDTLTFNVSFSGGKAADGRLSAVEDARLASLAINHTADTADAAAKPAGRLLVISHNDFLGDMAGYVAHKTSLGWTVDLVGTSTAGTTNTQIRSYIRSRYDDPVTRPDAVLLVGDTDRIPHFRGSGAGNPDTDIYYGCMDDGDDWYPELPVGRFSVTGGGQLADVIEKTIFYETSSSGAWTNHASFMAGTDNYFITEGTHNWVINQHMDRLGYTSDKLYEISYGANSQDVRNAFNGGRMMGTYSGHGGTFSWADGPPFSQADVRNLTNRDMYPLVASFACITGTYTYDECFMETWLRVPDKGAVVAVGSSVNSYWDEDDILEKRLFDAIYAEGISAYASAWVRAKELLLQHYGATSTVRRYFEMYNVMGDPTVEVLGVAFGITSPSDLPMGYVDEAYQHRLNANGGTEPYTWTVIAGALPAGMQLDPATGIISGTPTTAGTSSFTVQAGDAAGASDTRQFNLAVVHKMQITTPAALPDAYLGTPYSVTLQASGGTTPYSWSLAGADQYRESNPGTGYLGGGTAQGWQDDDNSWRLPLPWGFSYYGNTYNSVNVSSNGFLDFASSASDFDNTQGELISNVRIAPLWDDLVTTGGDIYVRQDADYVAIRWDAVTYSSGTPVDFEAVLYRNGDVQFNYGRAHFGLTPTIGVSAGDGTHHTISSRDGSGTIPAQVSSLFHYGGMLPEGLSFNGATGQLSGTPTAQGTFRLTLLVSDDGTPQQTDGRNFTLEVFDLPALLIELPASATEGDGLLAGQGTVSVPVPVAADLAVRLESRDLSELTLPAATVTIAQGQTSATFDVEIVDDAVLDGTQAVTVIASAPGYNDGSGQMLVHDDETAVLTVTLPEGATEGDGTLSGAGRVEVSAPPESTVSVSLSSDDTSEVTVPGTVFILAGTTSATFDVTIVDDTDIDATQTATVTAHVQDWTDGSDTIDVLDDDGEVNVRLPEIVWEGQGTLAAAGTVLLAGPTLADLEVMLTSSDPSELTVPATVTIPAGRASETFDLVVIDDADQDGRQAVRVSAATADLSGGSDRTEVGDDEVHHFGVSQIDDPQTVGVAFQVSLAAKDINDETIEVYSGSVEVTGAGDGGPVPVEINPPAGHRGGGAKAGLPWYQPVAASTSHAEPTLGVYHGYDALTADLAEYAAAHPAITQLVSIGQSVQGREIWALKITDNPGLEEDEPEVRYVAAIHGDEPVGTEMCLYFINELLTGYRADQRITDLIDRTEMWIVPLMNPDGREAGTRRNAGGRDLNRSFPEGSSTPIGNVLDGPPMDTAGRPPEVVSMMEFSAAQSFSLSANFHTGALVVNYPYDNDGLGSVFSPTPDEDLFVYLSGSYSIHNQPMFNSPIFSQGITNGAAWYSIDGGMQDWNYRYLGNNDVTVELSDVFWPDESTLPGFWADNQESMLSYFEAVQIGARGIVTDAATGKPVFGSVTVTGNPQPVFTDPQVGDYHRLLLPGTYELTFSAPGYESLTVSDVVVAGGAATRLDVSLAPLDVGIEFTGGRWTGRVAVTAVDTSVVLSVEDGAGNLGQSNPFDVEPGPLDYFQIAHIDSPQEANQPIAVTVTAWDSYDYAATNFHGSVGLSAWTSTGNTSTVVISEIDTNHHDSVELTNVFGADLDVSGWQITVYDWGSFPDPGLTFTIPQGTISAADSVFVLNEGGTSPGDYPDFYAEDNIYWNNDLANNPVIVLLQDDAGNVMDLVWAVDGDLGAITQPIAIPPGQWVGGPIPGVSDETLKYARTGDLDQQDGSDWITAPESLGWLNPQMAVPFAGGRRPVSISPTSSDAFVDGAWVGEVTVHEIVTDMYLQIDDGSGRFARSNTFDVIEITPPQADLVDVAPDPHSNPVEQISISFTEEITGLDMADLTLARDGGADLLGGGQWLDSDDNVNFTLHGLTTLTNRPGSYTLTLTAAGSEIQDLVGNPLEQDAVETWTFGLPAPVLNPEPSTTVGISNSVSWSAVDDAGQYYVEVDDDPGFASPDDNSGWIDGLAHTFTDLDEGSTYYYRAKAQKSISGVDESWSQTTADEFRADALADTVATEGGDVELAVGPPASVVSTVGSTGEPYAGGQRGRLNVYRAAKDALLTRIEVYLDVFASTTIEFVVYEGTPEMFGTYRQIHSSLLRDSSDETRFYDSGEVAVPIQAGMHYMIGAAWEGSAEYYRGPAGDVGFGDHVGIESYNEYPSPSILTTPLASGLSYYMRLTSIQDSGHATSGSVTSVPLSPVPLTGWDTLTYGAAVPDGTSLTVDVLPADGSVPIPGYENVAPGADLSGITEPAIRLRANLSTTDPDVTPALHDWSVTYRATPFLLLVSDWSNVESSMQVVSGGVVGRHVFYNNSAFDGDDPSAGASDDAAIAPDKQALLPGQTATFANYTGFTRGINGIMVDVDELPGGTLTADDFGFKVGNDDDPAGWEPLAAQPEISVRQDAGVEGSDRVTIIFDDNAVSKQWLQVTVLATANTGLALDDVFYFGNAIGECGDSTTDAKVNAVDMLAARDNLRNFLDPAPVDFPYDYNRDARVSSVDLLISRNNQTHFLNALKLITVPGKGAAAGTAEIASVTPGRLSWLAQFDQHTVQQPTDKDKTSGAEAVDALFAVVGSQRA